VTVPVSVGEADITTLPVPVVAVAVATFDVLPTQTSVEASDGSAELGVVQVLLPARNVVLFAVPEPSTPVGTVPLARLLAFRPVSAEPLPEKVPEKVPPVIVPDSVGEADITTLPVPVVAVAVATFDVLPTQTSVEASDGSAELGVVQVLLPARNVVLFAVPEPSTPVGTVPFDRLLAFRFVSDAPEPLNVVAVAVPLTLSAPLSVVVPMATCPVQVEFAPATVPVSIGDAESTTLLLPVEAVVHWIAVPLVAVQKLLEFSVPKLTAALTPTLIQLVPLQYCKR
jgi:hypothetical protein